MDAYLLLLSSRQDNPGVPYFFRRLAIHHPLETGDEKIPDDVHEIYPLYDAL